MRTVVYEDQKGYLRAAMIRDEDPDSMAAAGIPVEPPNLEDLDWEGIKRDIHNNLTRSGLFTWQDVLKSQNAITGIVSRVIKVHIVRQYRFEDQHAKEDT